MIHYTLYEMIRHYTYFLGEVNNGSTLIAHFILCRMYCTTRLHTLPVTFIVIETHVSKFASIQDFEFRFVLA